MVIGVSVHGMVTLYMVIKLVQAVTITVRLKLLVSKQPVQPVLGNLIIALPMRMKMALITQQQTLKGDLSQQVVVVT
jgi:hypothetical protein